MVPSNGLALRAPPDRRRHGEGAWLKTLGARLRTLPVPVFGRVTEGALRLAIRTLEDGGGFLATLDDFEKSAPES